MEKLTICKIIIILQIRLYYVYAKSEDCECGRYQEANSARIAGGSSASPNQFPWQAAIFTILNAFHCGATLITRQHILTAAHCAYELDTRGWFAFLGMHDIIARDGKRYNIRSFIIHPKYTVKTSYVLNDLAIGVLRDRVTFSNKVLPICLPQNKAEKYNNAEAVITGWGRLSHRGLKPRFLQKGLVRIITPLECFKTRIGKVINPKLMICAYNDGVDACQGDSGGPIFIEPFPNIYEQVGVTSFGIGCATKNSAGVYTRLTSYLDWIENIVKNVGFCNYPESLTENSVESNEFFRS